MRDRLTLLLVGLVLVAGACSDGQGGEKPPDGDLSPSTSTQRPMTTSESTTSITELSTTTPQPTTTADTSTSDVSTVENLVYLTYESGPWALDVYFSPDKDGGPAVVFFHGGGVDKRFPIYPRIAEMLAAGGGVVFMVDWDDALPPAAADLVSVFDAAGCAVSYAVAHGTDYGADPERLVLAGHSAGASVPPAAGGLRQALPVAGCAVAMESTEADGMVLWDGDWLMGGPSWDRYGTELPGLMKAIYPWSMLEDAPRVPVVLATSSRSPDTLRRCGVDDPDDSYWVRDPDGWLRAQLDELGMLDDGCIDNGEGEELLASAMASHGFDATHLILEDSGHEFLSDRGRAQLVEAILSFSDR